MTENLIAENIFKGESQTVEFIKSTSLLPEAVETVCPFANTHGGYLLFGVSDKGEVVGQDVYDATLKNIANTIKLNSDPKVYASIEKVHVDEK